MVNRFSPSGTARLDDLEYRREYGAERAKYEIALAFADARKQRGLTQEELAELVGVTQAYIAKLERGDANPTIGHIAGIAAAIWFKLLFQFEPLTVARGGTPQTANNPGPSAFEDQVTEQAFEYANDPRVQMGWLYNAQTTGTAVGVGL